jgi:hypothetical protein
LSTFYSSVIRTNDIVVNNGSIQFGAGGAIQVSNGFAAAVGGSITVPTTGIYQISVGLSMNPNNSIVAVTVNGINTSAGVIANQNDRGINGIVFDLALNANDVVSLVNRRGSAITLNGAGLSARAYIEITRIL